MRQRRHEERLLQIKEAKPSTARDDSPSPLPKSKSKKLKEKSTKKVLEVQNTQSEAKPEVVSEGHSEEHRSVSQFSESSQSSRSSIDSEEYRMRVRKAREDEERAQHDDIERARKTLKLHNMDGTPMTVPDFLQMAGKYKLDQYYNRNCPPQILDFGLTNTEYQKFKEHEKSK